ncbi:MAG: tRNA (uridine(34)/cytosine(34)/5-carboxymethylaminomethyluridine(34)-2'-O)-methyltransferase TrmL [Thermodesulfobacteria bacterium]|nr:tRNA (uridine(34)/cytosine(34)/5-carboxymethylaminomethyluridine(34)-2'-O)-methyltransferase TrmL [Thermodesulfobacteriota bacterium]
MVRLNVVLVEPEIPPNTGNIARLCAATCSRLHLVKPLGFSTDDKALKRAGLDYWKYVDVIYHEGLDEFLSSVPHDSIYLFSKKAKETYVSAEYQDGAYLLFGKETWGLPEWLLEKYSAKSYRIPMWGKTRSLNLSTAVGIVVYEAYRQLTRGFDGL